MLVAMVMMKVVIDREDQNHLKFAPLRASFVSPTSNNDFGCTNFKSFIVPALVVLPACRCNLFNLASHKAKQHHKLVSISNWLKAFLSAFPPSFLRSFSHRFPFPTSNLPVIVIFSTWQVTKQHHKLVSISNWLSFPLSFSS